MFLVGSEYVRAVIRAGVGWAQSLCSLCVSDTSLMLILHSCTRANFKWNSKHCTFCCARGSRATWSTCPCAGTRALLSTTPPASSFIFWMSSSLNQGRGWRSALILILLWLLSVNSCSVKLRHQLLSSFFTAASGLDKVFLWSNGWGFFFASEGSSERLLCFLRSPKGFFTACCFLLTLSDFPECFVACLSFPKARWCSASFALVWLPCICVSEFLLVCLSLHVPARLSAACLSPISVSTALMDLLLSRVMYVCAVCFTSALLLCGWILGFGPVLLTLNCGGLEWWWLLGCWMVLANIFLLELMPLLSCLFLWTSVWLLSGSLLMLLLPLPAVSQKGLGGTKCLDVTFPELVFQAPLWMLGSGCWKPAAGGGSISLGLDLKPPAELRARDDRRSMSADGKGSGRVSVITEIVRRRRKRGERRSSHFWLQQSFDHTRQACRGKNGQKEKERLELDGNQQNHHYSGLVP